MVAGEGRKDPLQVRARETKEGRVAEDRLLSPSKARARGPKPRPRRGPFPLPPLWACGRSRKAGEAGEKGTAEAAAAKEGEKARVEEGATAPPKVALVGAEAETVRARTTASAPLARWGCPTIVNSVAPLRRARNTSPRTARRNRPMSIGDMGRLTRQNRPLPFQGWNPRKRSAPPLNGNWRPG